MRIEDYALIGDLHTAALVGRGGSIDWLCLPRFDSPACFTALLGTPRHGRWLIEPAGEVTGTSRRYRDGALVLETDFETAEGKARVVDFMAIETGGRTLVRQVEGISGRVPMQMELVLRFDYGSAAPWVRHTDDGIIAVAGPNSVTVSSPVEMVGKNMTTVSEFAVEKGDRVPFTLSWDISYEEARKPIDPGKALKQTEAWWREWSQRCTYDGEWRDEVLTSLMVLKALIYQPSGGLVAAPTAALPEELGGERNWDYRYCWLRDSALTVEALIACGYLEEAMAFGAWIQRATAGHPAQAHILYGIGGERSIPEIEIDWLPGYEGSKPVRIGNAASRQFQLDVYGEVLDMAHRGRERVGKVHPDNWRRNVVTLDYLEEVWRDPDEGIWEVRGPRQHFVHSKMMAWVAFDRAVTAVEHYGAEGPLERWKRTAKLIHDDVCEHGYDAERNAFTQFYGSQGLDACQLLMPGLGFLPADDPRVIGTVAAIEKELMKGGFVYRYSQGADSVDGLEGTEGAFLPCSFWMVDCLAMMGRDEDARELFERLLGVCNDVGLLSEEYEPGEGRLLGNFPQAFSHLELINSAWAVSGAKGEEEGGEEKLSLRRRFLRPPSLHRPSLRRDRT
ncbi:MAG: glycoside hydrolase family 15 protein [Solirubrobacterales bacterium]|nr:glycoside hydrolase family 15 protein [Solirubrobacterales bacterium]